MCYLNDNPDFDEATVLRISDKLVVIRLSDKGRNTIEILTWRID